MTRAHIHISMTEADIRRARSMLAYSPDAHGAYGILSRALERLQLATLELDSPAARKIASDAARMREASEPLAAELMAGPPRDPAAELGHAADLWGRLGKSTQQWLAENQAIDAKYARDMRELDICEASGLAEPAGRAADGTPVPLFSWANVSRGLADNWPVVVVFWVMAAVIVTGIIFS
jgi:hypothetical protein